MKPVRIVLLFAGVIFALTGWGPGTQSAAGAAEAHDSQQPPPTLASTLDREISGVKKQIVEVAEVMPEDKYNFSPESLNIPGSDFKGVRTFALNLLHAAALDYVLIRRISGSNIGPDFGEGDNPSRDAFKTKGDVVKFVQEAVADGAQVIQQQGDAGLDKTTKFFGNRMSHNSNIWSFAIEHSGEHYGQLVVYYRANNLVPPDSRR